MAKYLTDPANSTYAFGQEFNYAVWTEGTVVTLTNVMWNNDYRDLCQFPSANNQTLDQYIDSNATTNTQIQNISYIKFNVPVRINVPFNDAFKFNYLRVQNPKQPIPNSNVLKSYYYFILDVKYVAPNTTEVTIQLDVFQSFRNEFTFGNSYIERGHIGIANENAFDNYGRDYLTIPEGIDTGSEYQITQTEKYSIYSEVNSDFDIMAVSTVELNADPGTVDNPVMVSANGSRVGGIPSGASVYVWTTGLDFIHFLADASQTPWVTQGIIGIYIIPKMSRYLGGFSYSPDSVTHATKIDGTMPDTRINTKMLKNWRNTYAYIPGRYSNLKKFFTFPYMVIEMTTWTGTPIIIKPESWNDPDATVHEVACMIPGDQRIVFMPRGYNSTMASPGLDDDFGEFLDFATLVNNFVSVPIINNMGISYLASNKNRIAFQHTNAEWTQSRALKGNEVSYDQTNHGISASKNINAVQNRGVGAQAANQNTMIGNNQIATGVGGIISSVGSGGLEAAIGGPLGAAAGVGGVAKAVSNEVVGAITTANTQSANVTASNITQSVSRNSNTLQNTQVGYVNDTNLGLANWAARGDYENSVAGINAKVNDSKMLQPTTSGQSGGDAFNLVTDNATLNLRWKTLDKANMTIVGEYWLRYGYAVHKFAVIPSSFMVMTKFTYWKLLETYIVSSSMPESFKQIIRGIFEKGVTVWADPSYIGTIDIADNEPLTGVTL